MKPIGKYYSQKLQCNILKLLAIKRVNTLQNKTVIQESRIYERSRRPQLYTIYTLNICTNQTSHKLAKNQKCLL